MRRPLIVLRLRSSCRTAAGDVRRRTRLAHALRLQVLGRLDDLGDEVLADANQRRVLREVARVDGRALRLDEVTFDGVAREVVDLDLAAAAPLSPPPFGLRDGRAGHEEDRRECTNELPHGRPFWSKARLQRSVSTEAPTTRPGSWFRDSFQKVPRLPDTRSRGGLPRAVQPRTYVSISASLPTVGACRYSERRPAGAGGRGRRRGLRWPCDLRNFSGLRRRSCRSASTCSLASALSSGSACLARGTAWKNSFACL